MPCAPPEHTEPSCGLSRSLLGTGKGGGVGWKEQTPQSWCMAHPVRVFPSHTGRSSPHQSLPSPTSHGSPCQNAPQSHGTWLTPSECSPVPQHMAHHVRMLPQSHNSACQGFLLSPLSPNLSVRNDPSECGFLSFLRNKMPSWVWWCTLSS